MNVVIYFDGEDVEDKRDAERLQTKIEDLDDGFDVCIADENEPESPDAPCTHYDALVGTVGTKLEGNKPYASAVTCSACVEKTKGWATMMTGLPSEDLLTYEEARARRDASGA